MFFLSSCSASPGYKEKDSSEMVILEPNLIARKYIKSWSVIIYTSLYNIHKNINLIARRYIISWSVIYLSCHHTVITRFVLDLISTIPVDYIFLVLDSGLLKTDTV